MLAGSSDVSVEVVEELLTENEKLRLIIQDISEEVGGGGDRCLGEILCIVEGDLLDTSDEYVFSALLGSRIHTKKEQQRRCTLHR